MQTCRSCVLLTEPWHHACCLAQACIYCPELQLAVGAAAAPAGTLSPANPAASISAIAAFACPAFQLPRSLLFMSRSTRAAACSVACMNCCTRSCALGPVPESDSSALMFRCATATAVWLGPRNDSSLAASSSDTASSMDRTRHTTALTDGGWYWTPPPM